MEKTNETKITGEPGAATLDAIYTNNLTLPIEIDGQTGSIESGPGGWGNVAIIVTFGDTIINARECESEDYGDQSEQPDMLELYKWEIEGEDEVYYYLLSDALAHRNGDDMI